ncbi:MAG: PKD domain-containing protein [Cyclobacteriaceae bacterium]|nr:PKD domain-containing protein [Cyclobacteriaceae bacterium]
MILLSLNVFGQCIGVDFQGKPNACINEQLDFVNTTLAADDLDYEWDFCAGDLQTSGHAEGVLTNPNFFRARSVRMIKEGNNWYGFSISATANILMRLDFGSDFKSTPTFTNLGNISGALSSAFGFDIIKHNGVWHIFVANGGALNILRLSFSNGIESTPTLSILQTASAFASSIPNSIKLVTDGGSFYAFVSTGSSAANTKLVRLDMGTSVLNLTPSTTDIAVPSSNQLRGLSFVKQCDHWVGFAVSTGNNVLYKLDFGAAINELPVVTAFNTGGALNQPISIEIRNEGGEYFAFIQNARIEEVNAAIYRLSFGSSILSNSPSFSTLSYPQLTGGGYALDIVNENSYWSAFTFNLGTSTLVRVDFDNTCSASTQISIEENPPLINYILPGIYRVTLKASRGNSDFYFTQTVNVSSSVAPDIIFQTQNVCASHPISFFSENTSGNIVIYDWNFGDAGTSSSPNPTHVYTTADTYDVNLNVTASNGCSNVAQEQLTVFNQPVADFTLPAVSPICTNQNYLFTNSTSFDAGISPSWEWSVNGIPISTNQNLEFLFVNAVSQEIKLKATIPGCESEATKSIGSVVTGPNVDFSITGQCEDAPVSFTNNTTGVVSSYAWDFGDGQNSTAVNPVTAFNNPGTYQVNLSATNAAGCVNTKNKPITIYSKPQTNFSVALPPFSCNGTPTQFTDLTPNPFDSNITSWLWNFGEGGTSTLRNPQHTFTSAGGYNVSLTATTNFGCSTLLELPVTISQSPTANFTNTPPCLGVPVSFTNTSTGTLQSQQWQIESTFYTIANPVHAFTTTGNKSVTLNVTATNGCVASVNRTLIVPNIVTPDFTFTRNCINQQTEFTSNTVSATDPISTYAWNFAGLGTGNLNPQNFSFNNTGNFNVSLSVTTQTGCVYSVAKNVNIVNAPQANFTATPSVGPPPLQVQFTNTSVNATSYSWAFNDPTNSTSTLVSPSFTYTTLGQYVADLTAFNAQGCSTIFSRVIHVVIPVVDVALTEMELIRLPDQAIKPAVSIQNKSNVVLANLSLRMELNGAFIRNIVPVSIEPNSTYRHVFDFELPFISTLQAVCVNAEIEDNSPDDNRICASVDEAFVFLAPYPNPVSSQHEINVEWVASDNRTTEILLVNSLGQQVTRIEATSSVGYNTVVIPGSGLQLGMYYVQIRYGSIIRTHRILVAD